MLPLLFFSALAAEHALSAGDPAPRIVIRQAGGDIIDSNTLAGSPYIVDFWSPRCAPCAAMVPALNRAHARLDAEGGAVLGWAAVPDGLADVAQTASRWGADYPVGLPLMPGQADQGSRYAVEHLPATFVVGRDGRLIAAFYRLPAEAELMAAVEQAVGP